MCKITQNFNLRDVIRTYNNGRLYPAVGLYTAYTVYVKSQLFIHEWYLEFRNVPFVVVFRKQHMQIPKQHMQIPKCSYQGFVVELIILSVF